MFKVNFLKIKKKIIQLHRPLWNILFVSKKKKKHIKFLSVEKMYYLINIFVCIVFSWNFTLYSGVSLDKQ